MLVRTRASAVLAEGTGRALVCKDDEALKEATPCGTETKYAGRLIK
jgi:hypothetical protein